MMGQGQQRVTPIKPGANLPALQNVSSLLLKTCQHVPNLDHPQFRLLFQFSRKVKRLREP